MSMHKSLLLFVVLPFIKLSANDFDNWYFDFMTEGYISINLMYPPDSDQHRWVIFADTTGKITKEGDKCVVTGEYYYQHYGRNGSYTAVWSKVKDSEYKGTYTSHLGVSGELRLVLKEDDKYELTGKYSNGTSQLDTGKLESDGRIYSIGKTFKNGVATGFTSKKAYEKKLKKKEP